MGYCPMKKDKIYNYNAAAMEIDKAPEGVSARASLTSSALVLELWANLGIALPPLSRYCNTPSGALSISIAAAL